MEEAQNFLQFVVSKDIPLEESFRIIPLYFSNTKMHSAIYSFLLAIKGYQESFIGRPPKMSLEEIFYGCFSGPDYAETLKRLKSKSFINHIDGQWLVTNKNLENISPIEIRDIGDIFNYSYCINWREPDNTDMLNYSFTVPEYYNDEDYEEFAYHIALELRRIDKKDINIIPKGEILLSSSSSMTINGIPLSIDKQYNEFQNYMGNSIGNIKNSSLQKRPTEVRNITLLEPNESNLVKWIDKQTLEIVKNHPNSVHVKDPKTFAKRFKDISKGSYFYCRDIEKEGLTKPTKLLEIMIEELYSYTGFECYSNMYTFSNIKLDGKKLLRGHGLGMANSLTTLMQIGIDSLNRTKLYNRNKNHLTVRSGFLNDDAAVSFEDSGDMQDYIEIDFETCENLQVVTKDSKSFTSPRGFVLCEVYYNRDNPDLSTKSSYYHYNALKPLNAVNISHAKDLAGAVDSPPEIIDKYVSLYTQKWGYEFHILEGLLPKEFGGWSSYKYGMVNLALWVADQSEVDLNLLYKLFQGCKVKPQVPKKIKEKIITKVYKKLDGKIINFQPIIRTLGYEVDNSDLRDIGVPTSIEESVDDCIQWRKYPAGFNAVWDSYYKKRQQAFKRACNLLSYEETYKYFKDSLLNYDCVIPNNLRSGTEDIYEMGCRFKEIYKPNYIELNKLACAVGRPLGFLYPNRLGLKLNPTRFNKPDILQDMGWINRCTGVDWMTLADTEEIEYINSENQRKYFINPSQVYSVMRNLGITKEGKMPVADWTHPLLSLKDEVYTRPLDIFEEGFCHELNGLENELIKQVTRKLELDDEIIEEFHKIMDPLLYFTDEPEDNSSDSEDISLVDEPLNDTFNKQLELAVETAMDNFTWSSVNYGAQDEEATISISRLDLEESFFYIKNFREKLQEKLSVSAYNALINQLSFKQDAWLIEDDSESDYGGFGWENDE